MSANRSVLACSVVNRNVQPSQKFKNAKVKEKAKLKFTLKQATKAQKGNRSIALLFL
jgi:hypothetical protein